MTLREIRSNCGNLQDEALHARLLNSSERFLDFSWVTSNPETMQVAEKRRGPNPPWDESLEWVRIGRGEFWRPVDSMTNGPGHGPFRNQWRGAGAVFTRVRKVERGGFVTRA